MINSRPLLLPLLAALALPLSAQTVNTLLSDTFADGERATQDLPSSAKWVGSIASGLNVTGNQLTQTLSSGSSYPVVIGYFTNAGSAVTLGVGDSLSLNFDVSFSAPSTNNSGFRFGLFDSSAAANRKTGDSFSRVDSTFADYTGYFTTATLDNGPGSRIYERGGSDLLGGSLSNHSIVGGYGGGGKTFAADTVYTASFLITRTAADALSLSVSYTGIFSGDLAASTVSHDADDTTATNFAFDAISFYAHGNTTAAAFALDNIEVLQTAAIPEPATAGLLIGGTLLAACVLRRRQPAA